MFVHKYSVEIFDIMTHSLMSTTVYTTHIFIQNIRHRISQYFNSVNEKFNLNIQQVLKYDLISVFQIFHRNIRHLISHLLTYSFKELLTTVTMSKETTVTFLQEHGVLRNTVPCPGPLIGGHRHGGCGKPMALKVTNDSKDKFQWRCRRVHKVQKGSIIVSVKDVKLSIRHESWMVDSKLPLETIVEFVYLWAQGFSHSEVMHELKLSKKTVTEWFIFLRDSCIYSIMDRSEQIGGNGVEVEIDESKFGKRKYHRGHRVEGQWVFGGREKYDKHKVFMVPVNNRKACTLLPLIKKWIAPGSIIHSDCWKAYSALSKMGYTHVTVNHSKEFIDKQSAACTNAIEGDWRHAKVHMPSYGTHLGDHAGYLAEFMWRRANADVDKFLKLLSDINMTFREKYLSQMPSTCSLDA